ncbi:MAG: hypothetical protein M5U26_01150 [Planctomycetota bacterium]|nr:hypothetical protein [Planctomycetota bacterium]
MSQETVKLHCDKTEVRVAPARGAIVTGLTVGGKEVLYLDRATLEDPSKNVRGGVPTLFPYAGKLDGGIFKPAGTEMKQHGFGRNSAWPVREQNASRVRMRLEASAETRAVYPYGFVAEQSVWALPRGMQIEMHVANTGEKPLPVSPGWHPYFCCPGPQKPEVKGDVPGISGDKLGNDVEFDFGVVAPASGRAHFAIPGLGRMSLSFEPRMRHLQVWSQPGKDFICLEPFWGPNNTVNTERRDEVPPGASRTYWMRVELED